MTNPHKSIRNQILERKGITLSKDRRLPITWDLAEQPYHRTDAMKLLERQFNLPMHKLLWPSNSASIYVVAKQLRRSPSCISKWRKLVEAALTVRSKL